MELTVCRQINQFKLNMLASWHGTYSGLLALCEGVSQSISNAKFWCLLACTNWWANSGIAIHSGRLEIGAAVKQQPVITNTTYR